MSGSSHRPTRSCRASWNRSLPKPRLHLEVPSTPWREEAWPGGEAESHAPASTAWRDSGATVRHTFTHFHLELDLWIGEGAGRQSEGVWVPVEELGQWALPSVMRKVVRSALAASQDGPEGTAP